MFYEFDDEVVGIEINELDKKQISAGFLTVSELEKEASALGISLSTVELCRKREMFCSIVKQIFDDYTFIRFSDFKKIGGGFAVVVKKNLFIVVDINPNDSLNRSNFMRLLSYCPCESLTYEKLVCAFIEITAGDGEMLKTSENKISSLEQEVIGGKTRRNISAVIVSEKQELLRLRSFYEQLAQACEVFDENENEIFDASLCRRFKMQTDRTLRLRENAGVLCDGVMHLWDEYQTSIDIKQNETMKLFTVITTVFMPMTVIVGWYGMNFNMPEFRSKYGYAFVIALNAAVVITLLVWFKRKKWI